MPFCLLFALYVLCVLFILQYNLLLKWLSKACESVIFMKSYVHVYNQNVLYIEIACSKYTIYDILEVTWNACLNARKVNLNLLRMITF